MLGFIYSNQSIFIVLGCILLLVIIYFAVKKMSTKVEKKEAKKDEQVKEVEVQPEKTEELDNPQPEENSELEVLEQEPETEFEKAQKKPKIVQIYKRRERADGDTSASKRDNDPIYNRNVEFINTSKNIAKFKSFVEENPEGLNEENENKDEFGFVSDEQEDCGFCEDKVKHFDHSRRLSSVMSGDSELFASHISDKYLNINSDRHLNLSKLEGGLLERADRMIRNSEAKVKCDCETHDECLCEHEECCHEEDDEVKINMKTALVADTYFNRKRKK